MVQKKMLIVGAAPFINGCTVYKWAPQLSADSWCSTVYKRCKLIVGAQHIFTEQRMAFEGPHDGPKILGQKDQISH